ncbi:Volume-regulated anion channel subunit [Nymphaea thermarum]|nr:Volume-regulated anion channel subunit [Nymphaea thermarum]
MESSSVQGTRKAAIASRLYFSLVVVAAVPLPSFSFDSDSFPREASGCIVSSLEGGSGLLILLARNRRMRPLRNGAVNLPMQIGLLTQLVDVNISSNKLAGSKEIVSCMRLQRLDLSNNLFTGSIPKEMGTLAQLELLRIFCNKLSGTISSFLGNLSHLNELQMGDNVFSGSIPSRLGQLSSLQIAMNLSWNNLSGEMPAELGNTTNAAPRVYK